MNCKICGKIIIGEKINITDEDIEEIKINSYNSLDNFLTTTEIILNSLCCSNFHYYSILKI